VDFVYEMEPSVKTRFGLDLSYTPFHEITMSIGHWVVELMA
jgi:hypothetical protein